MVALAGGRYGGVDDVEDRAQRDGVIEQITQEFDDAAQRAVANQHQAQDQLPQPGLGHGQVKQHLFVRRLGSEGVAESLVGGARCW